jgi:hypothetical protein
MEPRKRPFVPARCHLCDVILLNGTSEKTATGGQNEAATAKLAVAAWMVAVARKGQMGWPVNEVRAFM